MQYKRNAPTFDYKKAFAPRRTVGGESRVSLLRIPTGGDWANFGAGGERATDRARSHRHGVSRLRMFLDDVK